MSPECHPQKKQQQPSQAAKQKREIEQKREREKGNKNTRASEHEPKNVDSDRARELYIVNINYESIKNGIIL